MHLDIMDKVRSRHA
jgi:hypothetical protein